MDDVASFIIANEGDFEKNLATARAIGLSPRRLDPVYTRKKCVGLSPGAYNAPETGCFMAHVNAWNACAQQAKGKCLILERDWTIGPQEPDRVADAVEKQIVTHAPHNDIVYHGNCFGTFCTHAYTIKKETAAQWASVNPCDVKRPVDHFLSDACGNSLSCQYAEKGDDKWGFGEGVIRQNRADFDDSIDKLFIHGIIEN